ncbi:MAG: hypothetical protein Q7V57_16435 [Actinomycetota bacterium]|nr:hypothetical protein [Actinomycetota bacterium]
MRVSSASARRFVARAAIPVAVMFAAGTVWQASYAAFSAETRNSGNAWSAGAIALTDDDGGSARFTVENLIPGQTDTQCIKVTSNATSYGPVKMYTLNAVNTVGLMEHLKMTIKQGAGGTFASCTGFEATDTLVNGVMLSTMASTYTSYETGVGNWTPSSSPESMVFQITYVFDTTDMTQQQLDALQGTHAGIDFEWEMETV